MSSCTEKVKCALNRMAVNDRELMCMWFRRQGLYITVCVAYGLLYTLNYSYAKGPSILTFKRTSSWRSCKF